MVFWKLRGRLGLRTVYMSYCESSLLPVAYYFSQITEVKFQTRHLHMNTSPHSKKSCLQLVHNLESHK